MTSKIRVEGVAMTSRSHLKRRWAGWLGMGVASAGGVAKMGLGERGKHFVWVSKRGETSSRLFLESARIFTFMPSVTRSLVIKLCCNSAYTT